MKECEENYGFWLGIISGMGGNIAKMTVEQIFNRTGLSKSNGYTTASGIFLKKSNIKSPYGKTVGVIADNMIAMGLGVTCIYWLTLMGKDKNIIKGAGLGAAEWGILYGAASRLGVTSIFPVKPKDALFTFMSHLVFGVTKMTIAVNLGDQRLFKPKNLTLDFNKSHDY